MAPSPLFSVIIPTYNRRVHLEAAVKTILKQDYDSFEVVVVNNNCTDGSGELLDEMALADSRLRHVHEPVQGLNPARNTGLKEARGEIVAYFDDDELAPTSWLSNLAGCYEATGATGVGGSYRSIWDGAPPRWLQNSECFKEMLGVCTFSRKREQAEWLVGGNCSYRREALEEVGGFGSFVGYVGGKSSADGADVALGYRLGRAGHELWYEPEAYVFHKILRARQSLPGVLRRAFWSGYANAMNHRAYNVREKMRLARRRGSDAYLLGSFILPGYLYGRAVKALR
ncbi:MAG: glycosyltransferase [Armatimonadia bacterium]